MIKKQLFISLFLLFSLAVYSQKSGIISGKITDESQVPLPGANIVLDSGQRYVISNNIGSFEILNVPAGKYKISANYLGLQSTEQEIIVESGKNTIIDINFL